MYMNKLDTLDKYIKIINKFWKYFTFHALR